MMSDRGWALLGATGALLALWVAFGETELLVVAAVTGATVLTALIFVWWSEPTAAVVRKLSPAMVHEGDQVGVEMLLTNSGRRGVGNALLLDRVGVLGTASFEVGTLRPGETVSAVYQITCRPRGVYDVGPAEIVVRDPMGLARTSRRAGSADRLIVYPMVEDLTGFPPVRGRDPATLASRPEFSHRGGEDFYTLREYQTGDDLRRVHWPSSAKRDELMIRQLETPWQSRALVLLDTRGRAYENEACFEHAVRGAASVFRHLASSGFDVDLWTGGASTVGSDHYTVAMERLALVQCQERLDIREVAGRLRRGRSGGALFLVSGIPDEELLRGHQILSRNYPTVIVMSASQGRTGNELAFQRAGVHTIHVAPGQPWAGAWTQLTRRTWLGVSAR